jgi:potassium-dependent mechanosensitive channel
MATLFTSLMNRRPFDRSRRMISLAVLAGLAFAWPTWLMAADTAKKNSAAGSAANRTAPAPTAESNSPAAKTATNSSPPKSSGATTSVAPANVSAPAADAAPADPTLKIDALAAQLKKYEVMSDDDQPDKAKLVELYGRAIDDLKQAAEDTARIAELEKQRLAAPYTLELRRRESAAPPPPAKTLPPKGTLADWEEQLSTAEQDLEAARKTLAENEDKPQHRAQRRIELPQEIADQRMKLAEWQQSSQEAADTDESAELTAARRVANRARRQALESHIAVLEKELQTHDNVTMEILNLERDAAQRAVDEIEKRVSQWRDTIDDRRNQEAERDAADARLAAAKAQPAIRQSADENARLAEEHQQLSTLIDQLDDERQAIDTRRKKLDYERKEVEEKIKAAGLTDAVGQMLRKQRSELATVAADHRAVRARKQEIARVQLELFDYQEQLDGLRDLAAKTKELMAALPADSGVQDDAVRHILENKRKYLESLTKDDNSYFNNLVDLDSKQRQLISEAEDYRNFIDERVLWIRSSHPLSISDRGKAWEAALWLLSPSNWRAALLSLVTDARLNPAPMLLAALIFAPWFWMQRRLRNAIRLLGTGPAAEQNSTPAGALGRALKSFGATLLITAVWPALMWFVGRSLIGGATLRGEFAESLGTALQISAGLLLPVLLLRQICRHDGLAESHFDWPSDALAALRHQLTLLIFAMLPVVLIVEMFEAQSNDAWKDALGRLAFIVGQLSLLPFIYFMLRPKLGSFHRVLRRPRGSVFEKFALSVFIMLAGVPVALALLAAAGFYYTALRLSLCLQATVWMVLGLAFAHVVAGRWLTAVYRRLAMEAAARSLRIAQIEPAPDVVKSAAAAGSSGADDEPPSEVDLEKVDAQTQRLLHSVAVLLMAGGLCLVWSDVFPALRFLSDIKLWGGGDNSPIVSLANVLEAGIAVVMTIVAAANLPGLIEMLVLQRLPLDNGVRYAIFAVVRYAIAVLGLAVAGDAVGIGWPKLQWLAAAISFGLGFGLQEIFANFVSGLIVLFERPVRIGDTVTVGDVTGVVSRIRMRATTIVDGDRKELLVPNKEFITARLVNWTLSDSVIRLVIPLGLTYGSDPQQAQRLLLRLASEQHTVLKNPPVKAVFVGFGEKTINFELRVFVGNVEALMPTRHQLNMAIERAFRAAGIDIAIPQRETQNRTVNAASPSTPISMTEQSVSSSEQTNAPKKIEAVSRPKAA